MAENWGQVANYEYPGKAEHILNILNSRPDPNTAIRGTRTTAEISSHYGVHASQINTWKKQALEAIPEAFSSKRKRQEDDQEALVDELYKQIWQLTVERDWLNSDFRDSLTVITI